MYIIVSLVQKKMVSKKWCPKNGKMVLPNVNCLIITLNPKLKLSKPYNKAA